MEYINPPLYSSIVLSLHIEYTYLVIDTLILPHRPYTDTISLNIIINTFWVLESQSSLSIYRPMANPTYFWWPHFATPPCIGFH
jgi:hypothetical protein